MPIKNKILILFFLLTVSVGYGQNSNSLIRLIETNNDSIGFIQIKTDSVFSSNQVISLLVFPKNAYPEFGIQFGYNKTELKTTSAIAKSEDAIAAVNGGFFNIKNGGSVTYFEINDTVINRKNNPSPKKRLIDSLMNGAIIITKDSTIIIQPANSEQYYESSKQESAVLVTGPLLLLNSEKMEMPDTKFVNNRHPRTCLCKSKEAVIFVTIDGRQEKADGMSLIETQKFLLSIGCINAINLDGGGSTTMWTKNRGIVNFPSDKTGERPVANALLILGK